jgi:hypothetical protein
MGTVSLPFVRLATPFLFVCLAACSFDASAPAESSGTSDVSGGDEQGDDGASESTSGETGDGDTETSSGDGDSTSGDGDGTSGDGDGTSGDGDGTSGDGDGTSGDGDGTSGDGDGTSGDGDGTSGDGDGTVTCGELPPPTIGTPCPAQCDECVQGVCRILCETPGSCGQAVLGCPADRECEVVCGTTDACRDATINCNGDHPCSVSCLGWGACLGTDVVCAEGLCNVECGNFPQVCQDLRFQCGTNDSLIECQTVQSAIVDSSGSNGCGCSDLGC